MWLWWLSEPERLSPPARVAVQAAVSADAVHLSTISAWEVAMLVQRGRLELDRDAEAFVWATEALPFVHFVPVSNAIAVRSVRQEEPAIGDPADRILAATARYLGFPLVTADSRLRACRSFRTVW